MVLEEPLEMLSALAAIVSRADSMGVGGREKPRVQLFSSMISAPSYHSLCCPILPVLSNAFLWHSRYEDCLQSTRSVCCSPRTALMPACGGCFNYVECLCCAKPFIASYLIFKIALHGYLSYLQMKKLT